MWYMVSGDLGEFGPTFKGQECRRDERPRNGVCGQVHQHDW